MYFESLYPSIDSTTEHNSIEEPSATDYSESTISYTQLSPDNRNQMLSHYDLPDIHNNYSATTSEGQSPMDESVRSGYTAYSRGENITNEPLISYKLDFQNSNDLQESYNNEIFFYQQQSQQHQQQELEGQEQQVLEQQETPLATTHLDATHISVLSNMDQIFSSSQQYLSFMTQEQMERQQYQYDNWQQYTRASNGDLYDMLVEYIKTLSAETSHKTILRMQPCTFENLHDIYWNVHENATVKKDIFYDNRQQVASYTARVAVPKKERFEELKSLLHNTKQGVNEAALELQLEASRFRHRISGHLDRMRHNLSEVNAQLSRNITPSLNPSQDVFLKLKQSISTLFLFERYCQSLATSPCQHAFFGKSKECEQLLSDLHNWIVKTVSMLLYHRVLGTELEQSVASGSIDSHEFEIDGNEHLFIFGHVLSCPGSASNWAKHLIQLPSVRTDQDADLFIVTLKQILHAVCSQGSQFEPFESDFVEIHKAVFPLDDPTNFLSSGMYSYNFVFLPLE
eukprot:gb/GECH01010827.1/.p1 GENE.gb/GECH01010827.1/~~gb/GECH01010827.1/.p1  ORF type:complete len:513 (+),score=122.59 gb/GECH01010827.1/:1-1539(+)